MRSFLNVYLFLAFTMLTLTVAPYYLLGLDSHWGIVAVIFGGLASLLVIFFTAIVWRAESFQEAFERLWLFGVCTVVLAELFRLLGFLDRECPLLFALFIALVLIPAAFMARKEEW